MVSPVRRREAVEMVEDRLEVSQRRACSTLGQHRSTQRYRPRRRDSDAPLLAAMRRWARAQPRWGYEGSHAMIVYGLPAWRWADDVEDLISGAARPST